MKHFYPTNQAPRPPDPTLKGAQPFSKTEEKIMDLLVEAHNLFVKLPIAHPSDMAQWVDGIHRCQDVLFYRVVKRDYPDYFKAKPEMQDVPGRRADG